MSNQRRITARKPVRRRDVSGFGLAERPKSSSPGMEESAAPGIGKRVEQHESVELTIELHPSSQPDDFSSWLSDEVNPKEADKVVDVRLILPDEPP